MKSLFTVLVLSIGLMSSPAFALFGITSDVTTVSSVDPAKFVGTWYRISSKPTIFEPTCACARQVLTAKSDSTIGVYNTCDKNVVGGQQVTIGGYAVPNDSSFAKYDVHFTGVWVTGSYWVIALDPNYQWTVVSDSYGYSLYVMSRQPELTSDIYQTAVSAAAANGAPVDKLVKQVQEGCAPYPPINPL
jgi:apolipoprotein D and lipocalin family protein